MHLRPATLVLLATTLAASAGAIACDPATGERTQLVALDWNHSHSDWKVDPTEIHRVEGSNGFALGVKIEPADAEQYAKLHKVLTHVPETVKISLYDLGKDEPKLLTYTFGGANSIQGYGARGGADRVEELGDPGIVLTLLKAVCAP